jgi:hypothetical protein
MMLIGRQYAEGTIYQAALFRFRMSEKQLDRSQIASLAVDLRRFGAAYRMRAKGAAVHPGALDQAVHDARVLARGHGCLLTPDDVVGF